MQTQYKKPRQNYPSRPKQSAGFTLTELITTMIILSIISITVIPKLWDSNTFDGYGFSKQLLASLRYAQKVAIAQHRLVCANLTATTPATLTLTIANLSSDSSCSTTALNLPATTSNILTAPSGITLSPASTIEFNALGQANNDFTITITGVSQAISVIQETGYVYQ